MVVMRLPLTALELRSFRFAEIRADIGGRLAVVTKDMQGADRDELIERMARLQFTSERRAIREAAEDTQRAIAYARQ
jgi:hypothetical protein